MLFRKLSEAEKENVQEYTLVPFAGFHIEEDENVSWFQEDEEGIQDEKEDPIEVEKREILQEAIEESERIKQDAYKEGYNCGYKEGYDEGKEAGHSIAKQEFDHQYQQLMEDLKEEVISSISQIDKRKEEFLNDYMETLKDISIAVAEKIIQISLKSSDEIIKRMVIASTEKMKKKEWAKIYIGTSKESIQVQGDPNFMKELSNLSDNVKVIMMNEQEYGTCIVELPDGIMDISVATQLENIKDILNNAKLLRNTEE